MKLRTPLILLMCLLVVSTLTLIYFMKAEEKKFITSYGEKFCVMSLELPPRQTYIDSVVTHLDEPVKTAVLENLKLDNLFTFSWYPLAMVISILSALSLMRLMRSDHSPSNDSGQSVQVILIFLISAQVIAFILDRIENDHIIHWINSKEVHTNLVMFKTMAWAKFLLTLPGAITAVIIWIISCRQWKRLKRSNISI